MIRSVLNLALVAAVLLQQSGNVRGEDKGKTLVCAHRGRLGTSFIENDVAVMKQTYQLGIPMVEFDLRESKDGVLFLCHDATLDRTTNSSGLVSSHTAAELSHVLLRNPSGQVTTEPLNRFEALLSWAEGNAVQLLVDLKDTPPALAARALRRHGLERRAILLTFDAKTAEAALHADPKIRVSVLVRSKTEISAALVNALGHPLALYVPQTAESSVFMFAQRQGTTTLTDTLGRIDEEAEHEGIAVYESFLVTHPVNIVVTDHAAELQDVAKQQVRKDLDAHRSRTYRFCYLPACGQASPWSRAG